MLRGVKMVAPQRRVNVLCAGGMALGQWCLLFPRALATEHACEFKSESLCDLFSHFFFFEVSSLARNHSGFCECYFNGAIRKTGPPPQNQEQEMLE